MKIDTLVSSVHFRPIRSVTKKQRRAPTSAPAWKADVMLLDTSFAFAAVMPKAVLKYARDIVVPMKAES